MTNRAVLRHASTLAAALFAAASVHAQQLPPEGFLCCNLRSDGSWASDANYQEGGKQIIPAGTPLKTTGFGRFRVNVEINGAKQSIGNDYSRALSMEQFAARWIVTADPKAEMAKWPAKVQQAVKSARVMPGMTRQQVFAAVGYPIADENPNLDAPMLRFWLSSFAEFQVLFDDRGVVKEIQTDPMTKNVIVMP
jgi:hypothetical protein